MITMIRTMKLKPFLKPSYGCKKPIFDSIYIKYLSDDRELKTWRPDRLFSFGYMKCSFPVHWVRGLSSRDFLLQK